MTSIKPKANLLPWPEGKIPLMLAPMQGLTNRALRSLFIEWVRPDVVFTEFVRINRAKEMEGLFPDGEFPEESGVPLVVQLIGHGVEPLVAGAQRAQKGGAAHINLNLGCPHGRTTSASIGGEMLRRPDELAEIIPALRREITGSFSIKLRAGYDDSGQIFDLLPLFESAQVDFLILHPRTVLQEYKGLADHGITAEVVRRTGIPVIANGDICTAADGEQVLRQTGAAGLMLGRGALADPLLFQKLRGEVLSVVEGGEKVMVRRYLSGLLPRYEKIFCGEAQVLSKIKAVVNMLDFPAIEPNLKKLRKAKTLRAFIALLNEL